MPIPSTHQSMFHVFKHFHIVPRHLILTWAQLLTYCGCRHFFPCFSSVRYNHLNIFISARVIFRMSFLSCPTFWLIKQDRLNHHNFRLHEYSIVIHTPKAPHRSNHVTLILWRTSSLVLPSLITLRYFLYHCELP